MKRTPAFFAAVAFTVAVPPIQAQTLNWGNGSSCDLSDRSGVTPDNLFVFEPGAFFNGSVREVFDRAFYSENNGYFTSTVYGNTDLASRIPMASTLSFAGFDAYIWIRNGDKPTKGTEWLLTRADSRTFSIVVGGYRNTQVIEWAVNDLDAGDVAKSGELKDMIGCGGSSSTTTAELQTLTFVPEPSSALLAAVTGGFLVLRRHRSDP